ncbi:MAG TPA: hypothetical protein VM943_07015 [Pyrinomonadaceae bacterium]|nr:hypothetical protein [Pyrinomonadaceae bacterium]
MLTVTHQWKAMRLPLRQIGMAVAAVVLLMAAAGSSAAQSTNRDNPTPLKSDELKVDFSQDDPEYFYSFTAGPGEVVFTLDVKGAAPSGGVPYFHLFNTDGRQLDSFDQFAAGNASEKSVKRVSFARRQTVVMRVAKPIGAGSYRLRIGGAVVLEKGAATGRGNGGDSRMGLPANGTLRIEMNDGSAQEYDLRRVQRVTVKP